MSLSTQALLLSGLALSSAGIATYFRRSGRLPLPPGPPSIPLLGNIHQIPIENAWLVLTEMMEQFGDLVMFHGLGKHLLIINSVEVMKELFEKRYSIYSDRPRAIMVGELAGGSGTLPLLQYGNQWRDQRKVARIAFSADAVPKYHSMIEDAAASLCANILKDPRNFFQHVKLATGGIVLSATYGIQADSPENEFLQYAEKAMEFVSINIAPGKNLCDILPWMVYLPSWLPFHQEGLRGKRLLHHVRHQTYNYVKQQIAAGTALPSLAQRMLEEYHDTMTPEWEDTIRGCAAAMYGAGTETMYATVLVFILAMLLHPDKQAKAQAEIDSIFGSSRLPSVSDMDRLPYINAVIKETMRWQPVVPVGVPRCLREEDTYAGYRLPKGTVILPNVWALSREPNTKYPPDDFIPERFLDPSQSVIDPSTWAFGFGRRICPGKLLAEKTIFTATCYILASFNIERAPDSPTAPLIRPNGLSNPPLPFACNFRPRRQVD